jgi:exopolysaccharide biosynthesis WecB/TagA/CpsF family protein
VSVVAREDVIAFVVQRASEGTGALVANVNAYAMHLARHDADFAATLNSADVVFCDGAGVRRLGQVCGVTLGERMTPRDWIDDLFARCDSAGLSIFVVGGEEGLANAFAEEAVARHPRLRIAGWHHGFFEPSGDEARQVEHAIAASGADVVLVGMGMPRQELWAREVLARHRRGVFIPVGGLLKQYVGREAVCPAWMGRWGFEWAWRLAHDPARLWRRYLVGNTALVLQAGYVAVGKPCLDVVLAAALLVLSLPLLIALGVCISLDSPGPVLFCQERVGKGGRRFRMWKLRTLRASFPPNARKRTIRADDTTRIGRLLRRSALDELPQLVNVLRGEMSLVGPRPEMPFLARGDAPGTLRLSVRPGMTGLWQVARLRGELGGQEIHDTPAYDLEYVRRVGLRLDLAILWHTVTRLAALPFERAWRAYAQVPADAD